MSFLGEQVQRFGYFREFLDKPSNKLQKPINALIAPECGFVLSEGLSDC